MGIRNLYIIVGLVLAFGLFFEIVAYAQETSQEMEIRFSAPVQIPEGVLPAGTYVFKPKEDDGGVVRVLSPDGTCLYAKITTIAVERSITDEDLVVTVAPPDPGNPNFLVKWFYPGSLVGHALVYSGNQEQQIAQGYIQNFHRQPSTGRNASEWQLVRSLASLTPVMVFKYGPVPD